MRFRIHLFFLSASPFTFSKTKITGNCTSTYFKVCKMSYPLLSCKLFRKPADEKGGQGVPETKMSTPGGCVVVPVPNVLVNEVRCLITDMGLVSPGSAINLVFSRMSGPKASFNATKSLPKPEQSLPSVITFTCSRKRIDMSYQ